MLRPIFARPPGEIIQIPNKDAFIGILDAFKVPYKFWPKTRQNTERIDELWDEIEKNDAVYVSGAAWGEPERLVRFIITIAMRLKVVVLLEDDPLLAGESSFHAQPLDKLHVLTEFVPTSTNGEEYVPRTHMSSSISEKALLKKNGARAESSAKTIQRAAAEEPRFKVRISEIRENLDFIQYRKPRRLSNMRLQKLMARAQHVEIDYYERTETTPGLSNLNQIALYVCQVPERCYFGGIRIDRHTGALLKWSSVHEIGEKVLEPIPSFIVQN